MSTPKDKPRGYFDFLLAIDCETTGLCFTSDSPVYNPKTEERHQALSWGIIVADAKTLKPVDDLYVEIKWNQSSKDQRVRNPRFGREAEKIHGLTFEYLEENGVDEEEAVALIGELVLTYWGPDVSIRTLGHNVHMFDVPFLRDMFHRHEIPLRFGNRHMDSNSLAFGTVGTFNSDDLFSTLGMEEREKHNSLDDAKMALESFRIIRTLWKGKVGISAYEDVL